MGREGCGCQQAALPQWQLFGDFELHADPPLHAWVSAIGCNGGAWAGDSTVQVQAAADTLLCVVHQPPDATLPQRRQLHHWETGVLAGQPAQQPLAALRIVPRGNAALSSFSNNNWPCCAVTPSARCRLCQIILKRTTPVPWSAVGGVETFHATVPRTDVQDSIRSGIASAKATYQEKMTASKETVRVRHWASWVVCEILLLLQACGVYSVGPVARHSLFESSPTSHVPHWLGWVLWPCRLQEATLLREVKSLRNAVLHSGQNSRSKYCLHITDQQADRRKSSHPGATAAHMHAVRATGCACMHVVACV